MSKQTFRDYEILINSADSLLDEIKQLEVELEVVNNNLDKIIQINDELESEILELKEKLKEYEK